MELTNFGIRKAAVHGRLLWVVKRHSARDRQLPGTAGLDLVAPKRRLAGWSVS